MSTPRRDFLSWLGTGGTFAAAGIPFVHAPGRPFDAVPISDKWDMSWCDRVTGRVRAVFDSPEISDGAAMFRAQLWRDQHKEVYGTAPAEASAVLVVRHGGIPLAMNDAYWQRFEIGKEEKIRDAAGKKWAKANPVATNQPGMPDAYASYNIPAFISSGGSCWRATSRSPRSYRSTRTRTS